MKTKLCLLMAPVLLAQTACEENAQFTVATTEQPVMIDLQDVTAESGVDFTSTSGRLPTTEILEVNGGGIALFDYDRDGDPDLFIANGATLDSPQVGPGSRLFRNDSGPSHIRFTDVTEQAGINLYRWAMGAAAGDYDGDGFIDLHVSCWGQNALLRNMGDGSFKEITQEAGLSDDAWSTSSAFGDIDADGDLDLYVVNYLQFDPDNPPEAATYKGQRVLAGPHGLPAQSDRLWINQGDGSFLDAVSLGIIDPVEPAYGLNVIILDFDADGRQDILVGNDSMANALYRQADTPEESGRMINLGHDSGLATNMHGGEQATMGMAVADLDGDAVPELFTTNFSADTNTLHQSMGEANWVDRTRQYGLGLRSRPWLGWTTGFMDLDGDEDEDLIILNGHVYPDATMDTMDSNYEQPPQVLLQEDGRFLPLAPKPGDTWLGQPRRDRAGAFGDLDGDGDLDLVTAELNGPVRIIGNFTSLPPQRQATIIHLLDDRPDVQNTTGLGASIQFIKDENKRKTIRWIHSGGAFQSANDAAAHFTLPAATEQWEFHVTWPDGVITRHKTSPAASLTLKASEAMEVE
ncbi:MAG: hypothetical protein CMJ39_02235 [Phycisphaerae bacterium]|nr:hypothetical protein [Phycisphaerae bacterium]